MGDAGRTGGVGVRSSEDAVLVRAAQHDDTMALHDLLDRLAPYIARICGPIALDDAADAMQEDRYEGFRSVRTLREPEALHGWVRTIATREAVRVARRRTARPTAALFALPARGRGSPYCPVTRRATRMRVA